MKPSPKLLANPAHLLSLGLGSGLAPFAPGTFGTLMAIPLYLLMSHLSLTLYLAISAVLFVIGIGLCGYTASAMGEHDHPSIVWDEVVGYLITMAAAPAGWLWVAIGFVLFRIFDILKPWPIRWADKKVSGGLGIMLDDVLAGVYAWIIMQILIHWLI